MKIKKIIILIFLSSLLFSENSLSKGKEVYKNCSICHGENGTKKALGVTYLINGRDIDQLIKELNGYKNNTLNIHGMGKMMFSITLKLSDEDIKNVSIYINSMSLNKK